MYLTIVNVYGIILTSKKKGMSAFMLTDREIVKDGIVFEVSSGNTLTIVNASKCVHTNLMLPSMVNNMPVVAIASHAFRLANVTAVHLPATVHTVSTRAFANNSTIKTVVFNAPLVYLNNSAFANCYKLQTIKGNELVTCGDSVFENCKNLADINARFGGIVYPLTFSGCKRLEAIQFDDDVSVAENAFRQCMSIKDMYFKSKVTLAPSALSFAIKRTIHCSEDCPLVELVYSGTNVVFHHRDSF